MLPALERLRAAHPDDLRLVFKHFPVVSPDSGRAALAAEAAHRQGRFWEMHDELFALRGPLQEEAIVALAAERGFDAERFRADLFAAETLAAVEADVAEAERLGLAGTPAFFVNGRAYSGAQSYDVLEAAVSAALASARSATSAAR